jgi:hypothetical protein
MLPLVLDFAMLTLTIHRVYQLSHGPLAEPLLYVVLRDGTRAFLLLWCQLSVLWLFSLN